MIDNYMDGWMNLNELNIPPKANNGFQENVIIRNKVEPITLQRPVMQKMSFDTDIEGGTVMLSPDYSYNRAGETAVLNQNVRTFAVIKRLRTGEEIVMDKASFVIGKGSMADYIVQGNPAISRQHVTIINRQGEYYIEDMNSTNHTYIENERISTPVQLTDGCSFKLADEVFEFTVRR